MPELIPAEDLSSFGKIRVSGMDAVSVLHNVLTQDIKKLTPGQHVPAALLTHTGKILFYAEVFRFEDHLILVIENQAAAPAIALLDKYVITEDVQLDDVTPEYSFFQTFAPKPEKILCLKTQMDHFVKEHQLQLLPEKDCTALRIEAGIPRYGIDMDENTILSETGLDKIAVSGTKGCYPGQEVIARIETYKGLTKKLSKFLLEGSETPAAGDKIYEESTGANVGWITSAAYSDKTKKINALGYLLKGFFGEREIKTTLTEGKSVAGKSADLFF